MPIFDTHAHYDDSRFDGDRDAVLAALPEAGVELVLDPGCDLPSSRAAAALAERYGHVYAAAGIHPENCAGFQDADLAALRQLLAQPKVAAIGEIGLDYYWAENPPRDFQQMVFRKQLALAEELDLPVIVHDREAHGDSLSIIREFPAVTGVFHCFSGSPEMAEELLKRGWYLGFDLHDRPARAGGGGHHAVGTHGGGDGCALPVAGAGAGQAERQPVSAPRHCKAGGVEGRHAGGNDPHHL